MEESHTSACQNAPGHSQKRVSTLANDKSSIPKKTKKKGDMDENS